MAAAALLPGAGHQHPEAEGEPGCRAGTPHLNRPSPKRSAAGSRPTQPAPASRVRRAGVHPAGTAEQPAAAVRRAASPGRARRPRRGPQRAAAGRCGRRLAVWVPSGRDAAEAQPRERQWVGSGV